MSFSMFDDQTTNAAGAPPKNLPMEPDDIFAGVDASATPAPAAPNALNAGILRKKETSTSVALTPAPKPMAPVAASISPVSGSANQSVSNMPPSAPPVYAMKEPVLGKVILVIVLGVVLGGLGFGGWWVYNYMQSGGQIKETVTETVPSVIEGPSGEETPLPASTIPEEVNVVPETTTSVPAGNTDVPAQMNNDKILFGEPVDSDKDGLDDVREQELGTDPNKTDTDSDGLTDGDEVLIWKTNPLNPDTDGDSYMDGEEVRNGYNPSGPGKLFTATTSPSTGTNK